MNVKKPKQTTTQPAQKQTASQEKVLRLEAGKFCLDIANLIFGGVILAGLMKEDVDYYILFSCGLLVVLIFCFYGFLPISTSKVIPQHEIHYLFSRRWHHRDYRHRQYTDI